MDGCPSTGDEMKDGEEPNHRSADVHRGLDNVGPDHCGHAALKGIDQRKQGDDADGKNVTGASRDVSHALNRDANHGRYGHDAHTFGSGARQKKYRSGDLVQRLAKAALDELIGGEQLAFEIVGKQQDADDDASEEVTDNDLQKAEVGIVSQAGNADD